MQSLSESKDTGSTDEEKRLKIAREIINRTKFSPEKPILIPPDEEVAVSNEVLEKERLAAVQFKRLQQTQQMISDKSNKELYSMRQERKSMTDLRLKIALKDVKKMTDLKSNLREVVARLRKSLKVNQ
jgi:predicted P-loop ATPase/GTPase